MLLLPGVALKKMQGAPGGYGALYHQERLRLRRAMKGRTPRKAFLDGLSKVSCT